MAALQDLRARAILPDSGDGNAQSLRQKLHDGAPAAAALAASHAGADAAFDAVHTDGPAPDRLADLRL